MFFDIWVRIFINGFVRDYLIKITFEECEKMNANFVNFRKFITNNIDFLNDASLLFFCIYFLLTIVNMSYLVCQESNWGESIYLQSFFSNKIIKAMGNGKERPLFFFFFYCKTELRFEKAKSKNSSVFNFLWASQNVAPSLFVTHKK